MISFSVVVDLFCDILLVMSLSIFDRICHHVAAYILLLENL